MRFPAYLLLPIGGAVLLLSAVLGTWLWPEPTVSLPSGPAPAEMAPAAMEAPPPPPPSLPQRVPATPAPPALPPSSPMAMPVATAPSPAVQAPVAEPSDPAPTAPTTAPSYSQITNLPQQQQLQIKNSFLSLRTRTAELAERGLKGLERQREEAHSRGDVAEVDRLDGVISSYRERMEKARQQRLELAPPQAGPPTQ